MIFVGFVYSNAEARKACNNVETQMDMVFDSFTTQPEDSAYLRSMGVRTATDKDHVDALIAEYEPIKKLIDLDEKRIREYMTVDRILGVDNQKPLTKTFMDSCVRITDKYRDSALKDDVLAVYAEKRVGELNLTMVSLAALENGKAYEAGLYAEDVATARQKAPAYLERLEEGYFTAASDLSPARHAAQALHHPDYRANACSLLVVTAGGIRQKTTVSSSEYQPSRGSGSSYTQRLRLGHMSYGAR